MAYITTISEPALTQNDRAIFDAWLRQAWVWSQTRVHRQRVEKAMGLVCRCLEKAPDTAVMWSGGKDSTAMVHLVKSAGANCTVYSEKDDLDFPGELEYVQTLAKQHFLDLHILTPPVSPKQWLQAHAAELRAGDDLHSRAAELSKTCFYSVVEKASQGHSAIMLGLRQEESKSRWMNRVTHGTFYQKRTGQWVCTPLADWHGIDVYAYLVSREVPLLDVYRCVAFMHRDDPSRVRKSWWLPGANTRFGGVTWLRYYWPSLYRQLLEWLPDARLYA